MGNYVMDENGQVREEGDPLAWARWMATAERHVGDDTIGDARVSTVFLGTDYALIQGFALEPDQAIDDAIKSGIRHHEFALAAIRNFQRQRAAKVGAS